MKETYSQWVFAKYSTILSKAKDKNFLTIDILTVKLLNKSDITVVVETKALAAFRTNNSHRKDDKLRTRYTFYENKGYKEDNCWTKYPKKCTSRFKHQDSTNKTSIN